MRVEAIPAEEAHDKLVLASRGHTTGAAAGACKNLHSRPRGRLGACRGHRAPPTPLWRAAGPRRASHETKCPTVPNLYTSVYSKTPTGIRDRRGQRYTVLRQNTEYTYSVFCITGANCFYVALPVSTPETTIVISAPHTRTPAPRPASPNNTQPPQARRWRP